MTKKESRAVRKNTQKQQVKNKNKNKLTSVVRLVLRRIFHFHFGLVTKVY